MPHRSAEQLRAEIAKLEEKLHATESEAKRLRSERDAGSYLRAVLDAVPVGVVLTDEHGRIIHGNQWVKEMVRHPVLLSDDTESYGEWVSFHEDGQRVESHEYPLARVIRDGEDLSELDVHYQRGDGSRFWMRIIGRPVLDSKGDRIGAAVALIDVDTERRLEQQREILIGELDHRVKNAFTVVKAIVRRSLEKLGVEDAIKRDLFDRLEAYSTTHAKLVGSDWDTAPLNEIVRDSIGHLTGQRVDMSGPQIAIPARAALAVSMALYELATNAMKHGAFSTAEGRVSIQWATSEGDDGTTLDLTWEESGGPPVREPRSSGFGTFIITRAVAADTDGEVEMRFDPDGVFWRLHMKLES